jgi:ribosome-binding protein aMBF1 (putative translation factor)
LGLSENRIIYTRHLTKVALMKSTNTPEYKAIIEKLIAARKAKEMSQAVLAKALGKHQSYVAKIETGERRVDIIELIEIGNLIGLQIKIADK